MGEVQRRRFLPNGREGEEVPPCEQILGLWRNSWGYINTGRHRMKHSELAWGFWNLRELWKLSGLSMEMFPQEESIKEEIMCLTGSQGVRDLGRGMQETQMRSLFVDLGVGVSKKKEVFTDICRFSLWVWWCYGVGGGGLTMEQVGLGHPWLWKSMAELNKLTWSRNIRGCISFQSPCLGPHTHEGGGSLAEEKGEFPNVFAVEKELEWAGNVWEATHPVGPSEAMERELKLGYSSGETS